MKSTLCAGSRSSSPRVSAVTNNKSKYTGKTNHEGFFLAQEVHDLRA
jgi:hypothetical protein